MGDVLDRSAQQNFVLGLNPDPSEVPADGWQAAEQETRRIIWKIQPTVVSEGRRRDVVDYVQRQIRSFLGIEVFPYGSVPLKTYLPDGDIDLTAFGSPNMEDILVGNVRAVLEGEENNRDAEFEVKDVQYINAEVKLVKCLVQNIVVDISFNQIGGLCTLYFLEEVNKLIGKDNLFKHSIILIKAWCYYESRILGAHHALISTYALETLVLYIFHLFHASLDGPLAVLYKFLDYFSTFDWDNYCVSLHGPVPISSLPQIIAEVPQNGGGELLLRKEFLNESANLLPYFQRVPEISPRLFVRKHLNIVDPLKENNNLGRSVSKGNFHRIRSAFAYGARKLGRILLEPRESMEIDLRKFFKNTLERHGNGDRPDVRDRCSICSERSAFDLSHVKSSLTGTDADKATSNTVLSEEPISGKSLGPGNLDVQQTECGTSGRNNEYYAPKWENGECLAPRKVTGPRVTETRYNHSYMGHEPFKLGYPLHASSQLHDENGKTAADNCSTHQLKEMERNMYANGLVSQQFDEAEPSNGRISHSSTSSQLTSVSTSTSGHALAGVSMSSNGSDGGEDNICDSGNDNTELASVNGATDVNELADLSGDLSAHYENLLSYVQCSLASFPGGPPPFRGTIAWDPIHQRNVFTPMNGVVAIQPLVHGLPKTKGTGPYFPNMNQRSFRNNRPFVERGRHSFPNQQFKYRNNGHAVNHPLFKGEEYDKGGNGPDVLHHPSSYPNSLCRPGLPEFSEAPPPPSTSTTQYSGASASQIQIAFGSFGPVSLGDVSTQPTKSADSTTAQNNGSGSDYSSLAQKPPSPVRESTLTQLYKLKDEGDFPPLAGRGSPSSPTPLNRLKTVWEVKRASALS